MELTIAEKVKLCAEKLEKEAKENKDIAAKWIASRLQLHYKYYNSIAYDQILDAVKKTLKDFNNGLKPVQDFHEHIITNYIIDDSTMNRTGMKKYLEKLSLDDLLRCANYCNIGKPCKYCYLHKTFGCSREKINTI